MTRKAQWVTDLSNCRLIFILKVSLVIFTSLLTPEKNVWEIPELGMQGEQKCRFIHLARIN